MKNEFYQHKKSDKIKWIITGIAFVLAFVMIAGICMQLFGNDKLKPSNWFKKTECVHIDEDADGKCDKCKKDMPDDKDENTTADGSGLVVKPVSTRLMKLTATPMTASADEDNYVNSDASTYANTNSYTLTATITPSNATNQSVDWSVAWNSASSTWASGKTVTDYVTVTPASDGALTATVTCKKAFGEKIKITVTSRDNSTYSANCVCDYSKKVVGFTVQNYSRTYTNTFDSFSFTEKTDNLTLTVTNYYFRYYGFQESLTYSDYTVDDTFTISYKSTINAGYKSYLTAAGLTPKNDTIEGNFVWGGAAFFYHSAALPNDTVIKNRSFCGFSDTQANQAVNIAKQHTNVAAYNWTITCTGTNSTYTYSVPVYFAASSLTISATGVSLNNSSFLF